MTFKRAVIVWEDLKTRAEVLLVALSRLKTLEGLFLKPMSCPRLSQINKKGMIKLRIEEQKRLLKLQEKLNL